MLTPKQAKMWAKALCSPLKKQRRAKKSVVKKPPVVCFTEAEKKTIFWNALYGGSRPLNWWLLMLMTREPDLDVLASKVGKPKEELEKLYCRYRKVPNAAIHPPPASGSKNENSATRSTHL